ncbi:MAG TPA: TonB-dependent receptor plug domain-containing protein [Rhizomicrobium sp.]|nr:TonB-dependent receptor plug domain-containing protein [Rhizomicrobium sp.]
MKYLHHFRAILAGGVSTVALCAAAHAENFNIPGGDLAAALNAYATQSGIAMIASDEVIGGAKTKGVKGDLKADVALSRILDGTGFSSRRTPAGAIAVFHSAPRAESVQRAETVPSMRMAAASATAAGIESVVVTSSKIKGDIQTVPIAITALSQEQLTSRQIAGGPDLVKEVPNLTFSKTNFTGYNIQIRGIGTQAISVSTDPAVAVAFNDIPFIRNHFFEQEFYDVNQVEVLRGPQGTLYGRNATAGVVNVISAKPGDQFEAMASADIGNYHNRRYEGMINIPIVDDRLDVRVAGEWTKRDGYSFNQITNSPIDGRDLWSSRLSIGIKPFQDLQINVVWEHFQENDDRLRTSKQLCETDTPPTTVNGVPVPPVNSDLGFGDAFDPITYLSQACRPDSLYSPHSFEVPYGYSLPYVKAAKLTGEINPSIDPYASTTQSRNLRVIESTVDPNYQARNDVLELNADYNVTPELTFTSQTGFNHDFLWSTEDYNRFNTSPGIFIQSSGNVRQASIIDANGVFCDPQIGCADRLVGVDLSEEHAWQLSQEFRLASNFSGPLNFSIGGNFLHYETEENYYVFINALTLFTLGSFGGTVNDVPYVPGVTDNHECLSVYGYDYRYLTIAQEAGSLPSQNQCNYIDPNPISSLNDRGHNYFLSQNPYVLNSYAGFGEVYYQALADLKLTGGLRWTADRKHFTDIPSELLTWGWGYPSSGTVDQQWNEWTGRFTANWTPKLDFTDQTLVYGSFAHGYKAGGANPPGAILFGNAAGNNNIPIHPLTFKPEFIDAFELGTKNTLMDGALTLNGDVFFYNYKAYQISRIVDRTAINDNFDATVKGAEIEAMWEPVAGLKFNFAGGYEGTRIANGQSSIDLIDRADVANHPDWMVVRPYPTQASNCILPTYVVGTLLSEINSGPNPGQASVFLAEACGVAYSDHLDPLTYLPYTPGPNLTSCRTFDPTCPGAIDGQANQDPPPSYVGFNPATAPNNGEGFSKDLSGHQLPNAPHFTVSLSGEYTLPVSQNWAATLHSDFYWQSQSFARVFNDRPYDKIRGYSTANIALILTSADGWQVIGYLKNVFDKTAITGDFLNSDDSGLTTNVFLTDPRLYGVRVTKNF